jgi:DHA2 family multidrug resistance protein
VARTVQGLFGGVIIPCVFSAVFLLFTPSQQPRATVLAGMMAMLAPCVGPWLGGWITVHFGWRGLFFINLLPGVVAMVGIAFLLPKSRALPALLARLDWLALALLALGMASVEIALKQGPSAGWSAWSCWGTGVVGVLALAGFARHSLRRKRPLVDLHVLRDRRLAAAALLNFVLGAGLYGSTYVMVIFLGLVRGLDALAIGEVVLVAGVAQLVCAPVMVWLETRVPVLALALAGFAVFGVGCWQDGGLLPDSGNAALFWPQILRGGALMACILASTRLALGHLTQAKVANASGLFNLSRNLGGALGLSLIDSAIYGDTPRRAAGIIASLRAGDVHVAGLLHLPIDDFLAMHAGPVDTDTQALLAPLVQHLALTQTIDAIWHGLAVAFLLAAALIVVALIVVAMVYGRYVQDGRGRQVATDLPPDRR